jgi:hypothetical protein
VSLIYTRVGPGKGWVNSWRYFWAKSTPLLTRGARCPYYRPKESLKEQLVEGQANLVRLLEFVSLTEEEKLLVTEGVELHQALIEKLQNVPTPAGPTPRELEASRQGAKKLIPLKTVQRREKKGQKGLTFDDT